MIITAVAALAFASLNPDVQPKITAVSMFKNGFSFIARQTDIARSGDYIVEEPTEAAHGTFWHLPSDGISILRTSSTTIEKSNDVDAPNLQDVVRLNVGKQVTVDFSDLPSVTGTLMKSVGDQLVLKTESGIVFVQWAHVKRFLFKDMPVVTSPTKTAKRVMKLAVDAKNPGTITTIGLEHGLAWVPAYALILGDKNELQLVAKATIVNELADLDNVDASFITGFPNIRYSGVPDPLTSPYNLDQILQMLISGGFNYSHANLESQQASRITVVSADPAPMGDFTGGFIPQGTGDQVEDLFFYKLSGITLKKGDRAAYTLFTYKTPYEHVFTWNANQQGYYGGTIRQDNQDVWHSLTFKNAGDKPLTTGVVSVFSKNQILGQDVMTYTSAGADTEVQLNKAMDIKTSMVLEELTRDRAALQLPGTNSTYDLITVKGTLMVKNNRKDASKMRISTTFTGDLLTSDDQPKVTKGATNLGDLNPSSTLSWKPEVKAGETKTITYTYKVYVRTP
jgi:hypothetical protein